MFESETYDIVLLLGPMYHLFTDEDKHKAMSEAIRLAKKDGTIYTSYCNNDTSIYKLFYKKKILDYLDKGLIQEDYHTISSSDEIFELYRKSDIDNLMKCYNVTRLHFIGVDMQSTSDFKLIDRKVIDALLSLPERNTFFRALSFWSGFKSTEVEFVVRDRENGKSKWSFKSLTKYAISNVTSFTTAPLQLITVFGSILLLFLGGMSIQTLVRFFLGQSAVGFTTVILLLLLIGGSLMMALGIIGYYIARIYEEVKGRPRYIISKKTKEEKDEK